MRVLVCGGRDFDDWRLLDNYLTKFFELRIEKHNLEKSDFLLIQGEAKGADFLARVWAKYYGIPYKDGSFPADWKKYGKAAGSIRNKQMLDEGKPDIVVAFKGGTGTADMLKKAQDSDIVTYEVHFEDGKYKIKVFKPKNKTTKECG